MSVLRPSRQLAVDFAADSKPRLIGLALLLAGLVVLSAVGLRAWQLGDALDHWRGAFRALQTGSSVDKADTGEKESLDIKTELQAANRIVENLTIPWADMFAGIETAYSENAILLGVEPDPANREIRLLAEAKNPEQMTQFVRQVRASGIFADAHVASHQVNQQDAQRPIRFSVLAHWLDRAAVKLPSEAEQAVAQESTAETTPVKVEGARR